MIGLIIIITLWIKMRSMIMMRVIRIILVLMRVKQWIMMVIKNNNKNNVLQSNNHIMHIYRREVVRNIIQLHYFSEWLNECLLLFMCKIPTVTSIEYFVDK